MDIESRRRQRDGSKKKDDEDVPAYLKKRMYNDGTSVTNPYKASGRPKSKPKKDPPKPTPRPKAETQLAKARDSTSRVTRHVGKHVVQDPPMIVTKEGRRRGRTCVLEEAHV